MSLSLGTVTGEAEEMSEKDQRNAAAAIDEFELPLVSIVKKDNKNVESYLPLCSVFGGAA